MRKPGFIFVTILFAMLAVSCQKEIIIDLGGGANNQVGILKMKINGSQWSANEGASVRILGGFININGLSRDNKALTITLNDTVPGIYVLDQNSFHAAALSDSSDTGGLSYTTNEGQDTSDAGGTVIISSIDKVNKTISGIFKFKLYRDYDGKQLKITEGTFEKLPYSATLPPARLTDTFHVKIDNVEWKAGSISGIISGTDLFITGSELDLSKLVALSVPGTVTPGTYNLDALGGLYLGIYSPNSTTFLSSQSGKLTIIEHNKVTKRIRGNFDFKAVEFGTTKSAQLTTGYFSLVYQ